MIYTTKVFVSCGQVVALNKQNEIVLFAGEGRPIGAARRNLAKGEKISYSPNENTPDVIVRNAGFDWGRRPLNKLGN